MNGEPTLSSLPRTPTIDMISVGLQPTLLGRDDLVASEDLHLPAAGYQLGAVIGCGGMGEVLVAHDQRIGREVAIKRMRANDPPATSVARFLREGRIQARLDHPAIVPVYEMGYDANGRPFFTMKRLTGVTLAERLANPEAPRQPLLRAFAEVCLAVELAHSRGVVHRDLKPSNIMLGDFGEVYVIDWGVALVTANASGGASDDVLARDASEGLTATGMMLGTPGYMAPEQIDSNSGVSPAADVYALGSTLFEILTGEPLHPRGHPALATTLASDGEAPSKRRPERTIAPELDAACTQALSLLPAMRPTARELGERVQRYLDGDRDIERRRTLAAEQLELARAALAAGGPEHRSDAIIATGRALGFDPGSAEAADLLTSLIVTPPSELPADLVRSLAEAERGRTRARGRTARFAMIATLALSVFLPWLSVTNWTTLSVVYLGFIATIALAWITGRTGKARPKLVMVASLVMVVLISRLAGPFLLVPIYACGVCLSITSIPWVSERTWVVVGWIGISVLAPLVLEWIGVLRSTSTIVNGYLGFRSAVFDINGNMNLVVLIVANFSFLLVAGLFALAVTRDRREAQRSLHIQAWHLEQLLPRDARANRTPND